MNRNGSVTTLGDLLYADKPRHTVSEEQWVALVQCIAAKDQPALHALYERTHSIVFTSIARITNNRETAAELMLDVFCDVWRQAPQYDPAQGSVIAWIMNQVHSRAIDHRDNPATSTAENGPPNPRNGLSLLPPKAPEAVLVSEPTPSVPLWESLARRVAAEAGEEPLLRATATWAEPKWKEVAPGISCKLLATDSERNRVSMLVSLAPRVDYPPHRHGGIEELHLLHGELWINDRKLYPGDYNRAEAGSDDKRVWSETGCTCVLITSTRDEIG